MKSVLWLRAAAHPIPLEASIHGHDVIPAQAGIECGTQILDMSQHGVVSLTHVFAKV